MCSGSVIIQAQMDKTVASADEAIADLFDGATLMAGGFGLCGIPENLIAAIRRKGTKGLTIISNNCGIDAKGLGILLANGQVKKMISSYVGENKTFERLFLEGKLEVELTPQGTLAERIRAAGYGLGGVLVKTGIGTLAAEGSQTVVIDGETWLLERPLRADFALIHANQADYAGNAAYQLTATNFNPVMAMAADTVICEAREIVPIGMITPDDVGTPGVLVDCLIGVAVA